MKTEFLASVLIALISAMPARAAPPQPDLQPLMFDALRGWAAEDHAAAFIPFRLSCVQLAARSPAERPGAPGSPGLDAACGAALALPERPDKKAARKFFETWFSPALVTPDKSSFFTGYYEPEFSGALTPSERFPTPLLKMPDKLPDPAPDRAAIEAGLFAGRGLELVFMDPIDAFFTHIQGSARIRLPDSSMVRVNFAGRNGYPFTPVGRALVEKKLLTREQANMQSIRAWLTDNPKLAPQMMQENKSYIFFRFDNGRPEAEGPIGAQRVPLTAGRSIAVDDSIWPYGLPVWVDAILPVSKGEARVRRLMIAQDTGAAIRGAGRADLYIGSGPEAGKIAGRVRHNGHFIVFVPKAGPTQ
ncbi:lytic transglycosylase [Terrihabitans soli]|uniref:peptidoglycan lytic exotransglycosylase n=1 Tax=Terrihabitans soli TaxID=708113 RepID=A0A6S6QGR8_9HYPH|nr:MltA domain-containing protein [Terrihabitans soli]BCJ89324.1 lytic transglycosylase [Terrihabitans soli]